VVVNNAGQGDRASLEDTTIENFRRQIETNFLGIVYVSKAAIPILTQQGVSSLIEFDWLDGTPNSSSIFRDRGSSIVVLAHATGSG
jgi:NAD(P)-dependent dehydrogenase (short-subunit alcohol dehydrogenase family)